METSLSHLGIVMAGEVEGKEELKILLTCGEFSFYGMVDRKIYTHVNNEKELILLVNK